MTTQQAELRKEAVREFKQQAREANELNDAHPARPKTATMPERNQEQPTELDEATHRANNTKEKHITNTVIDTFFDMKGSKTQDSDSFEHDEEVIEKMFWPSTCACARRNIQQRVSEVIVKAAQTL